MTTPRPDRVRSILFVAGARPNFMKVAPLLRECAARPELRAVLVHTGQHYDPALSEVFFRDLGMRRPDHALEVGSGSHARQTAEVMRRIEPVLLQERPDAVLVVGDVNSTLAATLVAVKLGLPVAHVEAGLRSFDRRMPEEVNRIVTDALSTWHFTSEPGAAENLRREGIPAEGIHFAGNVMIDTLLACRERAAASPILARLGLENGGGPYGVVTLHRPSNVDDPEHLRGLVAALQEISQGLKLVFPVHPRTAAMLERLGLAGSARLQLLAPLGYLDFLRLLSRARLVITDSGGIQEETTILEVPCLTVRDSTERPVTVECGWNRLVGTDPAALTAAAAHALEAGRPRGRRPERWDGQASRRILDVLAGAPAEAVR
ncbi:MAG: non-hydrolyzing UDP-N-acetylglucosamine 2-epimerase [Candidatus Methylomirabilales bacterium]